MCAGYFYEGILMDVNHDCVRISDAGIVYGTGAWNEAGYADLQKLHHSEWFVQKGLIEAFGKSKNAH